MKLIFLLVTGVLFAACGDEETGRGPAGALEFHVTPGAVDAHPSAAEVALPLMGPSFFRTVIQDIPTVPPVSDQFDEKGHIIGIYGVPYVPQSTEQSEGKP